MSDERSPLLGPHPGPYRRPRSRFKIYASLVVACLVSIAGVYVIRSVFDIVAHKDDFAHALCYKQVSSFNIEPISQESVDPYNPSLSAISTGEMELEAYLDIHELPFSSSLLSLYSSISGGQSTRGYVALRDSTYEPIELGSIIFQSHLSFEENVPTRVSFSVFAADPDFLIPYLTKQVSHSPMRILNLRASNIESHATSRLLSWASFFMKPLSYNVAIRTFGDKDSGFNVSQAYSIENLEMSFDDVTSSFDFDATLSVSNVLLSSASFPVQNVSIPRTFWDVYFDTSLIEAAHTHRIATVASLPVTWNLHDPQFYLKVQGTAFIHDIASIGKGPQLIAWYAARLIKGESMPVSVRLSPENKLFTPGLEETLVPIQVPGTGYKIDLLDKIKFSNVRLAPSLRTVLEGQPSLYLSADIRAFIFVPPLLASASESIFLYTLDAFDLYVCEDTCDSEVVPSNAFGKLILSEPVSAITEHILNSDEEPELVFSISLEGVPFYVFPEKEDVLQSIMNRIIFLRAKVHLGISGPIALTPRIGSYSLFPIGDIPITTGFWLGSGSIDV